jgi:hypothetical protein
VLDVSIGGEASLSNKGGRLAATAGAEFVALQARTDVKIEPVSVGDFKIGGDVSGALNAGAIGGKAQAYVNLDSSGTFSAGFKVSASALFGAEVGLNVSVDARQFISNLPSYIAPVGQWLGGKIYGMTH